MSTTQRLKFYHVNAWPASPEVGAIYFNSVAKTIRIAKASSGTEAEKWEDYGGNLVDASYVNQILTITKATGDPVVVDLSDMASATAVAAAISAAVSGSIARDEALQSNIDAIYKSGSVESGVLIEKIQGLSKSDSAVAGKYVSAVSESNGVITVTRADLPVTAIKEGEKIISRDNEDKLQSTLTVAYVSDTASVDYGKLQIKGINSEVVSSVELASHFAKDSVLWGQTVFKANAATQTVSITKGSETQSHEFTGLTVGHQYLAMCFKNTTSTGSTYEWEKIDVNALVDVYTGGTAINVSNNVINVKNHTATDATVNTFSNDKNFLQVNGSNELQVKGIDADCAKTISSVEVNGGPLSSLTTNWPWKDGDNKNVVPANLSLQDFIQGLFLKVIDGIMPNPSYGWTKTLGQPNASLTKTGNQPVGTAVTATFSINDSKSNTHTVSVDCYDANQNNKKFGYYKDSSTTQVKADYSESKTGTYSGTLAITTATWKGGDSATAENISTGTTKYIGKGTNTLHIVQGGLTAICTDLTECTLYACTNTGVKLPNVNKAISKNSQSSYALSNSRDVTATGYYPFFYGTTTQTSATGAYIDGLDYKTLFGTDKQSAPTSYTTPAGFGTFIVAVPTGSTQYSKSSMTVIDAKGMSMGTSMTRTLTIPMLNNVANVNYKVFYITAADTFGSAATWTSITYN